MSSEKRQIKNWIQNGEYEQAQAQLKIALEMNENDGELFYLYASVCDPQGFEREAVPYYEKALELGLEKSDEQGAYLGLGSTYRVLGQYQDSKRVFEQGIKKFPNYRPLHVFYAMTLYNVGETNQALEVLLTQLMETTNDKDILLYQKAIAFYAPQLDEVWDQ
ncbi:tetratricopeptide repeat protein [Alkalihalobacillus pseudalcaliphilus]|uniref:tetratricopeptide repeat protein n=1 Tax=Alkalihalobacillus pseudalcaliphilus TaxID=79884 RepID=UPI00069F0CDD|nr:tetratricopeptide repeat protein [Alkalihalobacillus pseudalcaliphilus]